jgi:hypothetical protein
MQIRRFLKSLLAILAGNGIYFVIISYLPPTLQHQPFQIDWGLATDFWLCVCCWGILDLLENLQWKNPPPSGTR